MSKFFNKRDRKYPATENKSFTKYPYINRESFNYDNYSYKKSSHDNYDNYRNYYDYWKDRVAETDKENNKPHAHSTYWSSRFTSYNSFSNERVEALETVSRTCKVMLGTEELYLAFPKTGYEHKSAFLGEKIFLSPEILYNTSIKDSAQKIDVLCGDSLISTALRMNIPYNSMGRQLAFDYRKSLFSKKETEDHFLLYQSVEINRAVESIKKNYPGYVPYIKSYQESNESTYRKDLETVSNVENSFVSALTMVSSALQFTEVPINYGLYKEDVDILVPKLISAVNVQNRIEACNEALEYLLIKYPPPSSSNQDESDGTSNESDDTSNESDGTSESISAMEMFLKCGNFGTLGKDQDEEKFSDFVEEKCCISPNKPIFVDNFKYYKIKKRTAGLKSDSSINYLYLKNQVSSVIASIKSKVELPKIDPQTHFGYRSGILDEGALDKLSCNENTIFTQTEEISPTKLSITILVDESGSMAYEVNDRCKYESARLLTISLYEAFKDNKNIQVGIFGHSTLSDSEEECLVIEYLTPDDTKRYQSLESIIPRRNNLDGFAIQEVVKNVQSYRLPENQRDLVFVISDGQPAGFSYGKESAYRHMKFVCDQARNNGIEVFGLSVDYTIHSMGDSAYGSGNWLYIEDILQAGPIIGAYVNRILNS